MTKQFGSKRPAVRWAGYFGILILTTITLLAGFSVYLVMEHQSRTVLGQSLSILLSQKEKALAQEVGQSQGIGSQATLTYQHPLIQAALEVNQYPNQKTAQENLEHIAAVLKNRGFLAVSIFDLNGQALVQLGQPLINAALQLPLQTPYPSSLLWDDQFILTATFDVLDKGKSVGRIVTQRAMPQLTKAFTTTNTVGETSEILLCKGLEKDSRQMRCFLNGFRGEQSLEQQPRTIGGVPLPMDHALNGKTGIILAKDYRGEPVVAAYTPAGTLGLGMVLKIDQTEFYKPITSQLKYIMPLLVLLVLVGVALLRLLVMPIVRGLIHSEHAAKTANLDLQKSQDRYRQVIDNAPYSIHEVNHAGKLVSVNPAAIKITKARDENSLIGTDYINNISDQDKERVEGLMAAGLLGEISEFEYTGLSGRIFRAAFTPIKDQQNNVVRLMGWTREITQEKQHAEQLQRTQKMEALGKLTGGISHDFNNLLGIILGYGEMLEEALAKQPKLARLATEIQKAGKRGAKLTKRLQGFSRQDQSEKELVDINDLLQDMHHMLEKTLTARINLQIKLAENLWPVELDKSELEDAIVNISINAMHAMKGMGRFNVETANVRLTAYHAHALNLQPGDYVRLCLTDNGCGMDAAMLDKIFDPFFTTKGEMGTGLGLSQVFNFIESNEGGVQVTSEPGMGSRFRLYFARSLVVVEQRPETMPAGEKLPLPEGPANDQTGTQAATKMIPEANENSAPNYAPDNALKNTATILVVDDEAELLKLATQLLSRRGYRVFGASGAAAALKLLATEKIDLMLSDIIMPKMDGFELSAIVRQKYPKVKIQLVSGYADRATARAGGNSMPETWLHKPYRAQDLYKKIHDLLN